MKNLIKAISLTLTIIFLITIPLNAMASMGPVSISITAADKALLTKWKGLGFIDGSVDAAELNQSVMKVDFVVFINKILNSTKQADISFKDVPKTSWYGREIARAVASGFIRDSKDNFEPFSNITRIDAALMVAHVFGLELKDQKTLNKITDGQKLNQEQLEGLGAVIERGYLPEISAGRYAPFGVLRLVDAIKLLDKCIGQVISKGGTFTENAPGNLIVNKSLVTLKNMEVSGDLIIGEGVEDGTVRLENVTVWGKMIIRGGGPNSIYVKNSRVSGNLIVEKFAGNVNVVAQGTTTINQTELRSGGRLAESSLTTGKGFVDVTFAEAVETNQTAKLEGNFGSLKFENSNLNGNLNGKADTVNISKDTISCFTLQSGGVGSITTYASKSTIELLNGTVSAITVETGAKGNKLDINGSTTIAAITLKDTTTLNLDQGTIDKFTVEPGAGGSYISLKKGALIRDVVVQGASTFTGLGTIANAYVYANNVSMDIRPSSVYIASGITAAINGTTVDPTKPTISISVPAEITLTEGNSQAIAINSLNPYNSTLAYISSDNNTATVSDKGVVTGVSTGTTSVHVTAQHPAFNSTVAAIKVNVTSGNVTAPGSINTSPAAAEAGTLLNEFTIRYTAGDDMSNGNIVIKLPSGFSVFATDTYSINGGEQKALDASQRPDIQTIAFTNLNLKKGEVIEVKLMNRHIPSGGTYEFIAISDADGTGPKLPTSGQEKYTFMADSLKKLVEGYNYRKLEKPTSYGTTGGSIRITDLSFIGITTANQLKWVIKVQNQPFATPAYDESIAVSTAPSMTEYMLYSEGQDIAVAPGQILRLAAVDGNNKLKAYKDITIESDWIRPDDAAKLVVGTNYNAPEPGVMANSVRIKGLNPTQTGTAWMIKVQDGAAGTVFANQEFVDAVPYTSGDDISVMKGQHVILAEVQKDSANRNIIKAYVDLTMSDISISKPAGSLVLENNFSAPTYGSAPGQTRIETLAPGGFAISKWMIAVTGKDAIKPALDATAAEYEKYTSPAALNVYTANSNITAMEGQHLLLLGLSDTNLIKAYVDLKLTDGQIRKADVPEIPDGNFSAPVMGSTAGTTRFTVLSLAEPTTSSAIFAEAKKFMVKVQNGPLATPQYNSMLSGTVDVVPNKDIPVSGGQYIVLLATDTSGRIKAFRNIPVSEGQIRPADALKLITPNNYSLPQPGTVNGSTKIVLSSNGITGFSAWYYIVSDIPFEVPYKGSKLTGLTGAAIYHSGDNLLNMTVGKHILIIAVNSAGETLAYTDEAISYEQIKQPDASLLLSNQDVASGYNYSIPEPGQVGGTTRITQLSLVGVQEAEKWLYKVSNTAAPVPEYNSIVSNLLTYLRGDSVEVKKGQYLTLYAVDRNNRIKAYKNIHIDSDAMIRTPAATQLVTPTNYSAPSPGSTQGTTMFTSLSFAGLDGQDSSWKWYYAVGNTLFGAPPMNSAVSEVGFTTTELVKNGSGIYPDISVSSGQYILLLATNSSGDIKAYANVYVAQSAVRPYNAPLIDPTSYTLTKGTTEGSTRFNKLDLIGIVGATGWMIKTQPGAFEIPAKDMAVSGAIAYSTNNNNNIMITAGSHILLLATDQMGRVKAYADIIVPESAIQSPFAYLLTENTNYTAPEQGSLAGTVKILLSAKNIPNITTESAIEWKYKIGTQDFPAPHLNDAATGYTAYESNGNIPVVAGNVVLVVGVEGGLIKAFRQFTISPSQIKPANAPELVYGTNYTGPAAGSIPGATKLEDLKLISVVGADRFQIRVVSSPSAITLDSVFVNPINYASGADIPIKLNQYVVLAAVDASGRVKAYANIPVTKLGEELNPPLADKLAQGLNYAAPKYGKATGTTSLFVSPEGITGFKNFALKIVDAQTNIIAGSSVPSLTSPSGITYDQYYIYTSGADIAANAGQFILLVAVDNSGKILAFDNIQLTSAHIRPGDAVKLKAPENYTDLEPGAAIGTTKFGFLDRIGIPGAEKWIVKVQDTDLQSPPLINSSVEGTAVVYEVHKDIAVREGQFVILYAVDTTGRVKGYINAPVLASAVRGIAPQLKPNENYTAPVPSSELNSTTFDYSKLVLPVGATKWRYIVQDNAAGTLLKDSLPTGMTLFTPGRSISAIEGQHLILMATDDNGYLKAFADILLNASNIKNVVATISGTVMTAPTGEANIASGGRTIVVTLDISEWQEDIITNTTRREMLFDSFVAAGAEALQWGKVIAALKKEGASAISLSSDKKTITITLSEASTYDISKTQEITLTLKPELIKNAVKAVTSVDVIKIAADVKIELGGTAVTEGLGEGDIAGGGKTLVINLVNGEFAADAASNKLKRDAIFDGLIFSTNTTQGALLIQALKSAGETAITRNSSTKVTLSFPAVPGYDINTNDTLTVRVPYRAVSGSSIEAVLVGAIRDGVAPIQLTISARASAALGGTLLTGNVSETNVVFGGRTLEITLTDGQWVTDIETDKTKRDALFSGLVTSTEATEWAKVTTALKNAGQSAIKRDGNNKVTITLPAVSGYNINNNQYVTLNIPAACIIGAKASLIAGQTITIERTATAALSGTAYGASVNESAIRAGGKTIVITLTNATWVDDINTNKVVQEALFKGFTADVEQAQWDKVISAMTASAIVAKTGTAGNTITITLPAVNDYDLAASVQTISLMIPTSAAIGTSFEIPATNALTISSTLPTAAKVVQVSGPTGSYKQGDDISIKVIFDQEVVVVGTGNPMLNLETGNVDRDAVYIDGSGTKELTFIYTVQAGDVSTKLNYRATNSLALSGTLIYNKGTTVKATTALPALNSVTSLGDSNILVDAVAPKFASGYPKAGTTTETAITAIVKADEKAKVYYVALPTSYSPAPNAALIINEVVTGSAITGTAITSGMKGVVAVEMNAEGNIAVSGLIPFTEYTVYMVAVDSLGNMGTVTQYKTKTTDATAPAFASGYPKQTGTRYDNMAIMLVNTNEAGTVYAIALPKGSAAPTSAQVRAYRNASGGTVSAKGSTVITQGAIGLEVELTVTGLAVSSQYDIYAVCVDSSGNLTPVPAVGQAETSKLNLDNVGVDLSRGLLTNTTVQMEYSLDDISWKPGTAGNTTFIFDTDAEILTIYVREAINVGNQKLVATIFRADESIINTSWIDYDIAAGKITNSGTINLQYRINGGAWGALNASGSAINVQFVPGKLEVRTAAGTASLPSAAVTVDDIAVPMPEPDLKYNDNLNVIYGLSNEYEYRIDDGTAWLTGALEGVFSGTKKVEVRQKATKDKLPSAAKTINFTAGKITAVAYPAAETSSKKKQVVITFEEKTNKAYLSSPTNIADMVRQYFEVKGTTSSGAIVVKDWGSDFTAAWNTTGNAIVISYDSMTGASIKIGDEITVKPQAGIKNAAGTSDSYTSSGMLEGSFNTVPVLVSIKAVNSGNQNGFGTGDSVVLTFDQPTRATTFSAVDLGKFLVVTDSQGQNKNSVWSAVTTNSSIVWNAEGTQLTITFNNVTNSAIRLLPAKDKITINPALGLTDADETTEASNSSAFISGSFTSPPAITGIVITNNGAAGKNVGDTITITFNQATNKKAISSSALINYFRVTSADGKTTRSWGVQNNITWNTAGTQLTITLTSISGLSVAPGDILTIDSLAGIRDVDGGTVCDDSRAITGTY